MKISIGSSHKLNRLLPEPVASCLFADASFRVFESNNSFRDVDRLLSEKRINVLIVCVEHLNHIHKIRGVIRANPGLKVLITGVENQDEIFEYIKLGVKGHFTREITPDLLKRAIRVLHKGEVWFERELSAKVLALFIESSMFSNQSAEKPILSERELEVMECVSRGMKNRDISVTLHISESTVKTHLYKIYEKLGVKDRMSAVLKMKKW